jgi:hypothetical protein
MGVKDEDVKEMTVHCIWVGILASVVEEITTYGKQWKGIRHIHRSDEDMWPWLASNCKSAGSGVREKPKECWKHDFEGGTGITFYNM